VRSRDADDANEGELQVRERDDHQMLADRLERLLGYLEHDPNNSQLLADAASTAHDMGLHRRVDDLLVRLEQIQPLSPPLQNLRGLSCLAQSKFEQARAVFSTLAAAQPDPVVLYNLAYTEAMLEEYAGAVEILTDAVCDGEPRAIPLRVLCLHQLGKIDAAIAIGEVHAEHLSVGPEVCGMLANLYFDQGDIDQARMYAQRHAEEPAALTIFGLLAIENEDDDNARMYLARALTLTPENGRANLGEGLRQFRCGNFADAAAHLDKAATLLSKHPGSWLSAGWAYLLLGQLEVALERFEHATLIDRGFAEALGAQAMAHHLLGHSNEADRLCGIALRLDADCLAALRTASLLAEESGDHAASEILEQRFWQTSPARDGRRLVDLLGRYGGQSLSQLTQRRVH